MIIRFCRTCISIYKVFGVYKVWGKRRTWSYKKALTFGCPKKDAAVSEPEDVTATVQNVAADRQASFMDIAPLGEHVHDDGSICREYQHGRVLVYVTFNADANIMPVHHQINAQFYADLARGDEVCHTALAFFIREHPEFHSVVDKLSADSRDLFDIYSLHYPHPDIKEWHKRYGLEVTYVCGINHDHVYQGTPEEHPAYEALCSAIEEGYVDVEYKNGTLTAY